MATRNINSFIEHLMNESMTTSAAGGGTKADKGAGKPSTTRGMGGDYRSDDDLGDGLRDTLRRLSRRYEDKPAIPGEDRPGFPVGAPPQNPGPPIDADDIPDPIVPTGGRFERLFGRYGRIYKPYGGVYPTMRRK